MKENWHDAPYFPGFGKAATAFLNYGARRVLTDSEVLSLLYLAWGDLRSNLGYSPINETLLLGLINGLERNDGWFELNDGRELLLRAQKEIPGLIRFNVDRQGHLSVVRFLRAP